MTKIESIHWVFTLIVLGFAVAWVTAALADAPKGYLIPTPVAIPAGLSPISETYSPYTKDSYTLEYITGDQLGRLTIAESSSPPSEALDRWRQSYQNLISHSVRRGERCHDNDCPLVRGAEKIADVNFMGANGTLFHKVDNMNSTTNSSYDLLMDDNGRLLRIFAADGFGSSFHFTGDMVMDILHGMVRQQ